MQQAQMEHCWAIQQLTDIKFTNTHITSTSPSPPPLLDLQYTHAMYKLGRSHHFYYCNFQTTHYTILALALTMIWHRCVYRSGGVARSMTIARPTARQVQIPEDIKCQARSIVWYLRSDCGDADSQLIRIQLNWHFGKLLEGAKAND